MRLFWLLLSFALATSCFGQNYETAITKDLTGSPTTSYIVSQTGRILPNSQISATSGTFFMRATAANENVNYIKTETPFADVTTETALNALSLQQKSIVFVYFDGLGKKIQTVSQQTSPSSKDVAQVTLYDNHGKPIREFLPYVTDNTSGFFQSNGYANTIAFYDTPPAAIKKDARPFAEKIWEDNSINGLKEVFGPGEDWNNGAVAKSAKTVERINDASENIVVWSPFISGLPVKSGFYLSNQLSIVESIDEDGLSIREYKNERGQIVMKRVGETGNWLDTYYLYNPAGLLTLVIQPEGVGRLATEFDDAAANKQSFINRWCFLFEYDDEQRMIAKHSPGWDPSTWSFTVYDKWNRPVLTQNPAQKIRNEWFFNKYDCFNRVVVTGLFTSTSDRSTLQSAVNSFYTTNPTSRFETPTNSTVGYTLNVTYPQSPAESALLSLTYYDNYDFKTYTGWDSERANTTYDFENITGFPQFHVNPNISEVTLLAKGQMTGAKIRVLGETRWLNSAFYYDKNYRLVQAIAENFVGNGNGGINRTTTKFNALNKAVLMQVNHSSTITSTSYLNEYIYDNAGRLKQTFHTINGNRILMASNEYNEIGQLIERNTHSTDAGATFLQSRDQRFNSRGWLTSINNSALSNDGVLNNDSNDIFGMEISYNQTPPSIGHGSGSYTPPKFYAGNISFIKWKTDTKEQTAGYVARQKIYGYNYDVFGRFKDGYYAVNNAGSWNTDPGMFNEHIQSYDKNGNILGVSRYGNAENTKVQIDNTTYTYNYTGSTLTNFGGVSNRLLKVQDTGNSLGYSDGGNTTEEFTYDASGNLVFDINKQISAIKYNHLNLPSVIEFTRASGKIDRILYHYDANGTKLRTTVYKDGTSSSNGTQVWITEYSEAFQYDNSELSFVNTTEGRAVKNGSNFDYQYFFKDHQQNVRAVYGPLKETLSYRATMEDPPSPSTLGTDEVNTFKNIVATRTLDPVYNYTKASSQVTSPARAAQTNAFTSKTIGPAKSLRLLTGDKVRMEVFTKFNQAPGSTSIIAPATLVTALATTTFGFAPGEVAYQTFNTNAPIVAGSGNSSTTVPKAYLAFIFVNDSYGFITSGAVSVTSTAFNAFQKLERTFTASQNGYLYVYVANESNTSTAAVYFDEMYIVHQKTNTGLQVVQANDYYPFGLSFNSYHGEQLSDNATPLQANRFGYQNQELQKDLELGWYQFKWRMYEPAMGRFSGVDALADKYERNSTYAFSENKVIAAVEIEGLESNDLKLELAPVREQRRREAELGIVHPESEGEKAIQRFILAPLGALCAAPFVVFALESPAVLTIAYRTVNTAQTNPELVTGVTGLALAAVDPNPNTDYPGGLDDILRGGKLLLGKSHVLKQYASKIDDAYHMFKEGFGLGLPEVYTPANKIIKAMYQTVDQGGKIAFDLKDVAIDKAKTGFKNFAQADQAGNITEWELSTIMRDEELFKNTIFHINGVQVNPGDFGIFFIP